MVKQGETGIATFPDDCSQELGHLGTDQAGLVPLFAINVGVVRRHGSVLDRSVQALGLIPAGYRDGSSLRATGMRSKTLVL